jgi:hypothetical protein
VVDERDGTRVFARPRRPGEQHETVRRIGHRRDGGGQPHHFDARDVVHHHADRDRQPAAGPRDREPRVGRARHGDRRERPACLGEVVGHAVLADRVGRQPLDLVGRQRRTVGPLDLAVDAEAHGLAGHEVDIARPPVGGGLEDAVERDGWRFVH